MDLPNIKRSEKEEKAHKLYQKKFEKWSEKTDKTDVRRITIKLDSAMSDVKGFVEIEAPIEKLDEVAEKLVDYDARVRTQVSKQIGRPTLEEAYDEVEEE